MILKTAPWLLLTWLIAASVVAQQAGVKTVATVGQLHDAMIKPASDAIFNVELEAPKNAEEWSAVRSATVILAEAGNLLMLGSRARDRGEWMTLSRRLVDVGDMALRAAEASDPNALMQVGDEVVIVCKSCHVRYLKPARPPVR